MSIFFKKITIILGFFFLFSTLISAQTEDKKIKEIIIKGNKTVKERNIRDQLKLRKGDFLNSDKLKTDIQNVFSLGYFEKVDTETEEVPEGIKLIFLVEEKPFIKKIDFKGNKRFSNGSLKSDISLKEKEYFDNLKLKDDIDKILIKYKEKGYVDCRIESFTTFEKNTKNLILTFLITEGNRILIKEVKVDGTKDFKPKKIAGLIKTRKKKPYKEEDFQKDREIIISFYKNKGYMEMKLLEPKIDYNTERTEITITLVIDEGPKFVFGNISFSGNTVFSEKELNGKVAFQKKEIYKQEKFDETLQDLQALYAEKAYLQVKIEPQISKDLEKGAVDVNFDITEGKQVFVSNIFIEGNNYTKEYVLRREILVKEGDPLYSGKVRRSMEKLFNLGFLDDVKVDPQGTEDPQLVDLVF